MKSTKENKRQRKRRRKNLRRKKSHDLCHVKVSIQLQNQNVNPALAMRAKKKVTEIDENAVESVAMIEVSAVHFMIETSTKRLNEIQTKADMKIVVVGRLTNIVISPVLEENVQTILQDVVHPSAQEMTNTGDTADTRIHPTKVYHLIKVQIDRDTINDRIIKNLKTRKNYQKSMIVPTMMIAITKRKQRKANVRDPGQRAVARIVNVKNQF